MPTKDIELQRLYRRRWYKKNKKRQIKNQLKKRIEFKKWFTEYKRTLFCSVCGMSFENRPECCDFHHTGDKLNNIGNLLNGSMPALLREIDKCIPICANCHRTKHFRKDNAGQ